MDIQTMQASHQRLHEALCALCRNTGWSYTVFWRLRPRAFPREVRQRTGKGDQPTSSTLNKEKQNWVLMWEDGYSVLPSRATSQSGISGAGKEGHEATQLEPELQLSSIYAKLSYQLYNYGEGLIGKVALRGNHRWILRDEVNLDTPSSVLDSAGEQYPTGWREQFDSGIQTIAVIAVPQGVLQLGSVRKMAEDQMFVQRVRDAFSTITSFNSDLLSQKMTKALPRVLLDGTSPCRVPALPPRSPPGLTVEKLPAKLSGQSGASADVIMAESSGGSPHPSRSELLSQSQSQNQNQGQGQGQEQKPSARILKSLRRSFSMPVHSDEEESDEKLSDRGGNLMLPLMGTPHMNQAAMGSASQALASMKEVAERLIGAKRSAPLDSAPHGTSPMAGMNAGGLFPPASGHPRHGGSNLLSAAYLKAGLANTSLQAAANSPIASLPGTSSSGNSAFPSNASQLQALLANLAGVTGGNLYSGGQKPAAPSQVSSAPQLSAAQVLSLLQRGLAGGAATASSMSPATFASANHGSNGLGLAGQQANLQANEGSASRMAGTLSAGGISLDGLSSSAMPLGGLSSSSSLAQGGASGAGLPQRIGSLSPAEMAGSQSNLMGGDLQTLINSLNANRRYHTQPSVAVLTQRLQEKLSNSRLRQPNPLGQRIPSASVSVGGFQSNATPSLGSGLDQLRSSLRREQSWAEPSFGGKGHISMGGGLEEVIRGAFGGGANRSNGMGGRLGGHPEGGLSEVMARGNGDAGVGGSDAEFGMYNSDHLSRAVENFGNGQLEQRNSFDGDTDLFGLIKSRPNYKRSLSAPIQGRLSDDMEARLQILTGGNDFDSGQTMAGLPGMGSDCETTSGMGPGSELRGPSGSRLDELLRRASGLAERNPISSPLPAVPSDAAAGAPRLDPSQLAAALAAVREAAGSGSIAGLHLAGQQLQLRQQQQLALALNILRRQAGGRLTGNPEPQAPSSTFPTLMDSTSKQSLGLSRELSLRSTLQAGGLQSSLEPSMGSAGQQAEPDPGTGMHSAGSLQQARRGMGEEEEEEEEGSQALRSRSWPGADQMQPQPPPSPQPEQQQQQQPRGESSCGTKDRASPSSHSVASGSSGDSTKPLLPRLVIPASAVGPPPPPAGSKDGARGADQGTPHAPSSGCEREPQEAAGSGESDFPMGTESSGVEFPELMDDFMAWPGGAPSPLPWQGALPSPRELGAQAMPWFGSLSSVQESLEGEGGEAEQGGAVLQEPGGISRENQMAGQEEGAVEPGEEGL